MPYKELKKRHRKERNTYPQNASLRIHRSLSWLKLSEETQDDDSKFISLWIAFNAAYANETSQVKVNERTVFNHFIQRLVKLDKKELLSKVLWNEFPSSIRVMLNNQYIFQPFWNYHNSLTSDNNNKNWEDDFEKENNVMLRAISKQDTYTALSIIISRLYTLRNQTMHGGATWKSSTNREQIRDCTAILSQIMPAIICIMMDNPKDWAGDVCYPVINE